jgi:hypothetical protein
MTKPPKGKSTTELLKGLSKEELLELINSRFLFWNVTRREILLARIAVLEKKAKAHLEKWSLMELPDFGTGAKAHIAYYTASNEKEEVYGKYDKCHKQIMKLFEEIKRMEEK